MPPPAKIFERARGRLGAARCVLAELSDRPARLKLVSATQVSAVEQMCGEGLYTKVDAVQRTELVEIASRIARPDGDHEKVLTCLTTTAHVGTSTHSRRRSQEARAMINYFCEDEWVRFEGHISI